MSIVSELIPDSLDEDVLKRVDHVDPVDDVAETVDAVQDARATAADGTLGIVHTVEMGSSDYDYQ